MSWPFKKRPVAAVTDVDEAVQQRAQAEAQLRTVEERTPWVTSMTEYLAERRLHNHFGDSIEITFTPRRGRA